MSRRGVSILPFAFIALAISMVIISWSFYNVYFGGKYQATVFEHSKMDTLRNEMEKGKKFLKQSCIYSTHQSLFENAAGGGIIPSKGKNINTWICNSPMPPTVSKTQNCLEKFTKFYMNIYFSNFTINLPIDVAKAPYGDVVYNISRSGVFGGDYDEGKQNVFADEAKMSLSSSNLQITDNLNQNEMIDKNRFWYLWRNFYEWSQKNVYGKGICKCTSTCKGSDCAEQVAQKALKDLQKRFDENVICTKSCDCRYGCQGSDCGINKKASCGSYCEPSDCLIWRQDVCISKCNKDCADPKKKYPGAGSFTDLSQLFPSSETGVPYYSKENDGEGENGEECCPIYMENKLSAVYSFSCTDRKYNVPTGDGPKPLTFRVKAFASYRDKDGCGCKMQCPCQSCPQNKGKTC